MTKTKGKRNRPTLEDLLDRPWCYYCNKDFDDLKILVDHQKAKHYKCQVMHCNRRLNTVGGLRVHMQQVHKEELKSVPNSLDDRDDVNLEIFGMEGIPQQMRQSYAQHVTQAYYKQEAEHRARTGNNLHANGDQPAAKKPKLDDEARADLKKRVAEAKAKREAAKAAAAAGLPPPSDTASPIPQATPSPLPGVQPGPPPGVEQLSISSPMPANGNAMHFPTPGQPVYGSYNQHPPTSYAPPFHPIPHAVSPPGWAHSAGLPAPPGSHGLPAHFSPFPQPPGSNGQPIHFAPPFAVPPTFTSPPPHVPAPLPRPNSTGVHNLPPIPPHLASNTELNRLMDEQSKIALDRLNGKDASTEPVEKKQQQAVPLPEQPETTEKNAEKPGKAAKKKQPTKLVLSDNEVSWEEHRATLTRYQKPLPTNDTTVGTMDDRATGVVDEVAVES